jgi:hypothetical protein
MISTYSEHRVAQARGILALGNCDDWDGDHRHSLYQRHSHVLQTQHTLRFKMLDHSEEKRINCELYIPYSSPSIVGTVK